MLLVQQYLLEHSFDDLAKNHGVYASFSKSGHKFSMNYSQIESKDSDLLSQECRGLILSLENGNIIDGTLTDKGINRDNVIPGKTRVIAYPMRRFFNYGQGACANINWNDENLKIQDKMDGTLIILYYDPFINEWCCGTRSVPDADLLMDNGIYTFRLLFEKALYDTCGLSFENYTSNLDKEITYCFELTTPYNRIVVNYPSNKVTIIAARQIIYSSTMIGGINNEIFWSCQELDTNKIKTYGVPVVRTHPYASADDLIKLVDTFDPLENEGIVVCDSNFNRIKIKNINYVLYSKSRDTLCNDRAFLSLILNEKEDDFMEFLPEEFKNRVLLLKDKLKLFKFNLMDRYENIKANSNSKKEFALAVQKEKLWGAPLFAMYDKKCNNFNEFILQNKSKIDSSFSHSFLDKFLENILNN